MTQTQIKFPQICVWWCDEQGIKINSSVLWNWYGTLTVFYTTSKLHLIPFHADYCHLCHALIYTCTPKLAKMLTQSSHQWCSQRSSSWSIMNRLWELNPALFQCCQNVLLHAALFCPWTASSILGLNKLISSKLLYKIAMHTGLLLFLPAQSFSKQIYHSSHNTLIELGWSIVFIADIVDNADNGSDIKDCNILANTLLLYTPYSWCNSCWD